MDGENVRRPLTMRDFLPQGDAVQGFFRTLENGNYVHAYLISGMAGVGKRSLAMLAAQYLLCTAGRDEGLLTGMGLPAADKPCGCCPGCRQVLSGNHPDLIRFGGGVHISTDGRDAKKEGIVVGDIRETVRIAGTHTYEGGNRVFIIEQAHTMNTQAQNCLLKTLEEPVPGTVFLLLTDSPSLMLSTIISRCRHLRLHAWPDEVVMAAMEARGVDPARRGELMRLSGGSVGKALEIAEDGGYWQRRDEIMRDFFSLSDRSSIARVSNAWKDRKDRADVLFDDVMDMLRVLMMVSLKQMPKEAAVQYPQEWQRMAEQAPVSSFMALFDAVSEARMMRKNQVTWQALLERLLFRLMEEKVKWSM